MTQTLMNKATAVLTMVAVLAAASCSNDEMMEESPKNTEATTFAKMNQSQAQIYASLFTATLSEDGTPMEYTQTRSTEDDGPNKEIDYVDYVLDGSDTLIYIFNYKDDKGFMIIGADNASFPILAHSNSGHIKMSEVNHNSSFYAMIEAYKVQIKDAIHNPSNLESEYYEEWKDLGAEGYEYEIEIANDEPVVNTGAMRGRRKSSSGKATITTQTGGELKYWEQRGGYNMCAPNQACIGCPAIAIGMLMYDTNNRINGNQQETYPRFYASDSQDISDTTTVTSLAQRLRQIADSIPNYHWGSNMGAESGAQDWAILTGLHKLGYKNATLADYNFETLYQNLTFETMAYGHEVSYKRGVLLCGLGDYNQGGHIWFCDGYYEQSYKVKKKFLGIKVKSWMEYDDRLYMNWGWGPEGGNGWYAALGSAWSSIEGNPTIKLKNNPQMYINLDYYELPN